MKKSAETTAKNALRGALQGLKRVLATPAARKPLITVGVLLAGLIGWHVSPETVDAIVSVIAAFWGAL